MKNNKNGRKKAYSYKRKEIQICSGFDYKFQQKKKRKKVVSCLVSFFCCFVFNERKRGHKSRYPSVKRNSFFFVLKYYLMMVRVGRTLKHPPAEKRLRLRFLDVNYFDE